MKFFEYLVRDLLLNKCEHLIRDTQHGFRNNKSILSQLLPFADKLATALILATLPSLNRTPYFPCLCPTTKNYPVKLGHI